MNYLYLILFLIIFIIIFLQYNERFSLNMPQHLRFLKKNKFDDQLSQDDVNLLRKIQGCYRNRNTYYSCINKLGSIPYLRNPKPSKSFKKEINYKKHRSVQHLLPYRHKP